MSILYRLCAAALAWGFAAVLAAPQPAAADQAASFLDFPMVEAVSAARAPAFTWLARNGERTSVYAAHGPEFRRVEIASRTDADGIIITETVIDSDGRNVAFVVGAPKGESVFNPASLIDPPVAHVWLAAASGKGVARDLGVGTSPAFTPDGKHLLFVRGGDLMAVAPSSPKSAPKVWAKGGARWAQRAWTPSGDLILVDDRRGYSFLGRYRPGADRVEWLVTGADRLAAPVVSPDGSKVAMLRLNGRKHTDAYDFTEGEPFAIDVLDLANGQVRTVWRTRGPAISLIMDDPEGALRWAGNDNLVFYSEDDDWGRLYAIPAAGGTPRALTPTGCTVAESEAAGDSLLVIHNCRDRDSRQLSLIDIASGAERPIPADLVLAIAAGGKDYAALAGGGPDAPTMIRFIDLKSGRIVRAEQPTDYGYRSPFTAPPPRTVQLTSTDGMKFSGQLFMPTAPGPHPALVYVHGGPPRQMFAGFHYFDYYANDYAINRKLADLGYAVLSINYRSGIGYGRNFRDAPGRAWRDASEYRDVLAAGQWLARQPGVDPDKIGIWGGSYGGLLTAQALSRNSDLFKAGVAVHGVFDWSWPSPIPGHLSPSTAFGVGEKDRERAHASSPVGHLAGWRSPVLLIHGDDDMNVDVVETIDLASRLRDRGVDVRVLILPGEPHTFIRNESWERAFKAMEGFLAEKLPAGGAAR